MYNVHMHKAKHTRTIEHSAQNSRKRKCFNYLEPFLGRRQELDYVPSYPTEQA